MNKGKPSYTTPGMVKEWEQKQAEKEAQELLNRITNEEQPETNLGNFIDGYNSALDSYFKAETERNDRVEVLDNLLEQDRTTKTLLNEEVELLNEELKTMNNTTKARLEELSNKLIGAYTEQIKPKGSDLIKEDQDLLNSGIELTKLELQDMADNYSKANNDTMTRILKKYAKDRNIHLYTKDTEDRFKAVNRFMNSTYHGLDNDSGYSYLQIQTPEHRTALIETLKQAVQ